MTSFRQIDEKHVSGEVTCMKWSPKMDLIAIALAQGEVALHRLSWQKVWVLPACIDGDKKQLVTALSWRPDGKVLAVSYDLGRIVLCDVENGFVLHSHNLESGITSLSWTSASSKHIQSEDSYFTESSTTFLPKLPSLTSGLSSVGKSNEESFTDVSKINNQEVLNILVAGTKNGFVHLLSFGIFPSGEISPSTICSDHKVQISIISATLSEDLDVLMILLRKNLNDEFVDEYCTLHLPLLSQRSEELKILALKFGHISALMSYLDTTIKSICEAWEDILLEIDSKLTNFARMKHQNSSGSVSDDFLELLIFGTATVELEKFLLQDLTEKGLKKLGHSIELSYSNIQKLVLKHLQNVGQALMYHLAEVKGMSLWYDQFGILGLSIKCIEAAIQSTGAFMMKATEIQQVIDSSMKNFKAFFRWLYAVILKLCDEPIPTEFNKVTQQDLNFVAEFLIDNFTEKWNLDQNYSFHLERVGQYLKNENLPFPPNTKNNPWVKFIESNPTLKDNEKFFSHDCDKSLIQQYNNLKDVIHSTLRKPAMTLGEAVQHQLNFPMFKSSVNSITKYSHLYVPGGNCLYTAIAREPHPSSKLYFIRQNESGEIFSVCMTLGKTLNGDSSKDDHTYKIIDFYFYNEYIISLLLENTIESFHLLVQLPMKIIDESLQNSHLHDGMNLEMENSIRTIDIASKIEHCSSRKLENVNVSSFSVSGTRKVSCVLFASRRRVRIFEMDAEDEEDDENSDLNFSKDSVENSLNETSADNSFSN